MQEVAMTAPCQQLIMKSAGRVASEHGEHVHFTPPTNLIEVLEDYLYDGNTTRYQGLLHLLHKVDIEGSVLKTWLCDITDNILLLNKRAELLVAALLRVSWADQASDMVKEYQNFLLNLVSAHSYYTSSVFRMLLGNFLGKCTTGQCEMEEEVPSETELYIFSNTHAVLKVIVSILPMSAAVLLELVSKGFPYVGRDTHTQACYVKNVLHIISYLPEHRVDILKVICSRLVTLDVSAPKDAIKEAEDEDEVEDEEGIFQMEVDETVDKHLPKEPQKALRMKHPVAHTLDVLMVQLFDYIRLSCSMRNEIDWEKTSTLYKDMRLVFDAVILPTHASCHVQFLLFYLCSFKATLYVDFLDWLWKKVVNPDMPSVMRQSAASYVASLLCRGKYVGLSTAKNALESMCCWIHRYINAQDSGSWMITNLQSHGPFYTVCQAVFYVFAFRHQEFVGNNKNLAFIRGLNFEKIVTCRLNPLKACLPQVMCKFASVCRTYQLAYCNTIIERNNRLCLPVVGMNQATARTELYTPGNVLDSYFPFDEYLLVRSNVFVKPLFQEYHGRQQVEDDVDGRKNEATDEEEFPEQSDSVHSENLSMSGLPELSYVKSPGFRHL